MSGYVKIHRSLIGHPAFRNDAEAMAFAWLVCRAAWKPCRVRYKERAIKLERGQLAISVRDFATAMDRDKAWIERLLNRLRGETMIETLSETGVTVVTICKYDAFQAVNDNAETPTETLDETPVRQGQDTEQEAEEEKKERRDEASPHLRALALPVGEASDAWNESAIVVGWPPVSRISEARRRSVNCRLREHGLDGWKAAIARARSSPYLGRDPPSWFTFDWLIKPANFLKLIEGNYDRNRSDQRQAGSAWGAARDTVGMRP